MEVSPILILLGIFGVLGLGTIIQYFWTGPGNQSADSVNRNKRKEKIENELNEKSADSIINNLSNKKPVLSIIESIGEPGIFSRIKNSFISRIRGSNKTRPGNTNIKDVHGNSRRRIKRSKITGPDKSQGSGQERGHSLNGGDPVIKRGSTNSLVDINRPRDPGNTGSDSPRFKIKNVFKDFILNKTNLFGMNPDLYKPVFIGHPGLDYGMIKGTELRACLSGVIGRIGNDRKGYGKYLMIWDPEQKLYALYAHLSKFKAKQYQGVQAGQLIGLSGNTGRSTAPHLHFALLPGTEAGGILDPDNGYQGFINPLGKNVKWL
jgi:murein DD-endopeptidase MepM/ murein hydrolase activator NlpD